MKFTARFTTTLSLAVDVEVDQDGDETDLEEVAADIAWEKASEYLATLGNHHDVRADASLDGIGAEEVVAQR